MSKKYSQAVSRSSFRLDSQTSDKSFELPEVHVTIDSYDDNVVYIECNAHDLLKERIEEDKEEISSKYLLTSTNLIRRASIASSMAELGYRDTEALKEFLETCTQGRLSFKDSNISCPEMVLIKIEDFLFGWEYPPWWKKICYPIEKFIMDPFVDLFITICIIANTALMALDHADISENMEYTLKTGNYIFTGIFASEALLKILALGMLNYIKNRWNIFDLTIVILSSIEVVLRKIKSFSILRSFRLLRIFKLAKSWPTLNLLIGIIGRTVGALGNLCLVLAIIIFIFAVMGVQFFGKDYEKAKHQSESVSRWNFVDFSHSFMIVFRVLCGEWIESMWDCMRWSTSSICIPFFLLTMIIGNLVVLNLFLALLLSSFGNNCFNQEEKINEVTKLKEAAERMHRFFLYLLFKCRLFFRYLLTGNSRVNEVQKVTKGGVLSPVYSNLTQVATVTSNDNVDSLQKSLQNSRNPSPSTLSDTSDSEDSSNELTSIYGSRIKEVTVVHVNFPNNCCPKTSRCGDLWSASMKTKCGRRWWAFRCYCKILVESKLFEMFTIFIIVVSSLSLAMEDKNIDSKPHLKSTLKNLDKIFTVAFTMELLLKMTARGFIHFFKDPWCWLDFIIVAVSLVVEAGENTDLSNMVGFRALRTLRALRPLKAVARWEGMKVVVNALFQAIPAIFNVLLVCLVFWLIFSIIGVTLFAGKFNFCTNDFGTTLLNSSIVANKNQCEIFNLTWHTPKVNFDNVAAGYLALFQVATFKGWTDIMKYATDVTEKDEQPIKDNAPSMYLYFVTFIIFGSFFTLNLFIGVIIDNFNVQKRKTFISYAVVLLVPLALLLNIWTVFCAHVMFNKTGCNN